jgi:hypothetical protein
MKGAQLIQCHNCGSFYTEHSSREEFGKHFKFYQCECGSFLKLILDGHKMLFEVWENGEMIHYARETYKPSKITNILKESSPYRTMKLAGM